MKRPLLVASDAVGLYPSIPDNLGAKALTSKPLINGSRKNSNRRSFKHGRISSEK